jgi:hypothetical protein
VSGPLENMARAICAAEGVDPDLPCPGLGNLIPVGETRPAWRVRLPRARAAMVAMCEWLADTPDEFVAPMCWSHQFFDFNAGEMRENLGCLAAEINAYANGLERPCASDSDERPDVSCGEDAGD